MNKKFIAILVGVVCIIGGFLIYNNNKAQNTVKGTVKISVDPQYQTWLDPLLKKFKEDNNGVTIETISISMDDQKTSLQSQISNKDSKAPDVFIQAYDTIGLLEQQELIRPYSKLDKSLYDSKAVQAVTYKNQQYLAPISQDSLLLYYNKDLLKEEEVPKTIDEMFALQAKAKNDEGKEIGLAINASEAFYTKYAADSPLFDNDDDPKVVNLNNDIWTKGAEKMGKYLSKAPASFADPKEANKIIRKTFIEDKKALAYVSGPWDLSDAKKALGDKLGISTITDAAPFSGLKGLMMSNATKEENKEVVEKLAIFLSTEGAKTLWEAKGELPSHLVSRDAAIKKDPVAKVINDAFQTSSFMPKTKALSEYWPEVKKAVVDIANGKDAETVMNTTAEAIVRNVKSKYDMDLKVSA